MGLHVVGAYAALEMGLVWAGCRRIMSGSQFGRLCQVDVMLTVYKTQSSRSAGLPVGRSDPLREGASAT